MGGSTVYPADLALQEQPEDNFLDAISQAWYNGSYPITVKPAIIVLYDDPVF